MFGRVRPIPADRFGRLAGRLVLQLHKAPPPLDPREPIQEPQQGVGLRLLQLRPAVVGYGVAVVRGVKGVKTL